MNIQENDIICLKVDFEKDSLNPERVFKSMRDLILSVQTIHSCLLESVSTESKTNLYLSNISEGSVKSWIYPKLDAQNNEKNTTSFLNKCTEKLINFIKHKDKISSLEEIEDLKKEFEGEAINLKVENFPNVFSLDERRILKSLTELSEATEELLQNDNVFFEYDSKVIPINKKFSLTKEDVEELFISKTIENIYDVKLVIKKADFIGNSMWDFILDKKVISVKILDHIWLERFKQREEKVFPGYSLSCRLKSIISVDKKALQ